MCVLASLRAFVIWVESLHAFSSGYSPRSKNGYQPATDTNRSSVSIQASGRSNSSPNPHSQPAKTSLLGIRHVLGDNTGVVNNVPVATNGMKALAHDGKSPSTIKFTNDQQHPQPITGSASAATQPYDPPLTAESALEKALAAKMYRQQAHGGTVHSQSISQRPSTRWLSTAMKTSFDAHPTRPVSGHMLGQENGADTAARTHLPITSTPATASHASDSSDNSEYTRRRLLFGHHRL